MMEEQDMFKKYFGWLKNFSRDEIMGALTVLYILILIPNIIIHYHRGMLSHECDIKTLGESLPPYDVIHASDNMITTMLQISRVKD
jgi:hypothetical protein